MSTHKSNNSALLNFSYEINHSICAVVPELTEAFPSFAREVLHGALFKQDSFFVLTIFLVHCVRRDAKEGAVGNALEKLNV